MKKNVRFISFAAVLFFVTVISAFAQQKYALVIGNGHYTSFGTLPNTLNDAQDMKKALDGLGFTTDMVTDGSRAQMAEAITRFKNRLSVSKDSYGFFYYAGHGLQYNGINYLIPAKADIPNANYLGDTSISVQTMLAELNDAGNELNIVVLDACRDFPAAWSRSVNRGLTVVTNQPADSIIVYATSAGSVAADGDGKNGLFTGQLLKYINTPGMEVSELFRLTGAAVKQASNSRQVPAVYNQFFGKAFLGAQGGTAVPDHTVTPVQAQAPKGDEPVKPPAKDSYKIGDTGPGGGTIFYSTDVSQTNTIIPPVDRAYNVGENGPAGGVVFYDASYVKTEKAPPPVTGEYKIGDTGPAGGIIFYVNTGAGDWKYLEAAPASTEQKNVQWSVSGFPTGAQGTEAGTGKANTRNIMDASVQIAINAPAARLCDRLQYGGYDDWYLPSKNELGLMYMNLKIDGLGGFGGGAYWSSSESNNDTAWLQDFSNGSQHTSVYNGHFVGKGNGFSVRAIRQF